MPTGYAKNGINKGQFKKGLCSGANNLTWKGDNAGYVAKHMWVKKWKGKPNHCERCGTTEVKKYHWANIDHKYRRVLEDYISMCVSCHRLYDYEHNNYAPKGRTTK